MFRIIYKDNHFDKSQCEIFQKDYYDKSLVLENFSEMFEMVKKCIIEELVNISSVNKSQEMVFKQIIKVVQNLEAHEEIELKASDEVFLICKENFIEFDFLDIYVSLELLQI